ncbi:MAG: phosphoribosylglycinamide formyltransferase [Cohaesibacteraceae bacterium]
MRRVRTAILISGRGSNMEALVRAARTDDHPAEIVLVGSNRPEAAGIKFASDAGLPTVVVDHKTFGKAREAFERALHTELKKHDVELVCLAGFMRLLTPWFIGQWHDRLINIHPSLLPLFKGLHTHQRALEAGVKLHGCTVHVVRPDMDAGPIIAQSAVPVLDDDDPDTLAERVLVAEHALYQHALAHVAQGILDGSWAIKDERVSGVPPFGA